MLCRFGLKPDEGYRGDNLEELGEYGPYVQSKRVEIHRSFAHELVKRGRAFPCFCEMASGKEEILKRIPNGFLYAFDQDDFAIEKSDERLKVIASNYTIIRSNFANMERELAKLGVDKVDGILFDLGVSSVQIDQADRGFSFHQDARLDMRMDTTQAFSAYNLVNEYDYSNLVRVLRDYGEEKFASSIAKNIIKAREKKPVETTFELVDIIKKSMPMKAKRDSHPARRSFQAIRVEVNRELEVLEEGLEQAIKILNKNGRLCVISFQSLEDRIVKQIFKHYSREWMGEPGGSDTYKGIVGFDYNKPLLELMVKKPIVASEEEIRINPPSRSAKLRIARRINK